MLPSPTAVIPDSAHAKLYAEATWGGRPVIQDILDAAQAAHARLETTIDPERLVYVAGYDRPTPYRVRVNEPGRFSFQETREGDGRVPHDLGLLDGVATYWVNATHGDLAKSEPVLDAITDLLQRGATDRLPTTRPRSRGAVRSGWARAARTGAVVGEGDAEVVAISRAARARGRGDRVNLTPREALRLEGLVLGDYLGVRGTAPADAAAAARPPRTGEGAGRVARLAVDVVWGDVTLVDADVYVAGHYIGVIPQNAELALDRVVSGIPREVRRDGVDRSDLVITQQSLRGIFRGALGEISFFPWGYPADRGKLVAIAGMGHPGTYSIRAQRRLVRELVLAIGALPNVRDVVTVLIGSGEGTLSIPEAVRSLVEGIGDALVNSHAQIAPVRRLIIAERSRERAIEIHAALRVAAVAVDTEAQARPGSVRVRFRVGEAPIASPGGDVSSEEALALLVNAGLRAARNPASRAGRALEALIGQIPTTDGLRRGVREGIRWEAGRGADGAAPGTGLPRFRVEQPRGDPAGDVPVRISFWQDDRSVRVAAIHESATVPERVLRVQPAMVDDLVERLTDPAADQVGRLSAFLARLLVPSDFRDALRSGPFVFEVDRPMARVQWEMLSDQPGGAGDDEQPLAVRTPLARQLRTVYSPPPMPPARPGRGLRALVIGDPGDPAAGNDLPGARLEALAVARLLRERLGEPNVDVRIGAPSVPRVGELRDVSPADWLDVLDLLTQGGYDLVHYAGHGDFDPADATRAGWLFAGGLITSGEIERLDEVPSIVVANACLSALTARDRGGRPPPEHRGRVLQARRPQLHRHRVGGERRRRHAVRDHLLRRAPAGVGSRCVLRRGGPPRPRGALEGPGRLRSALGGLPALRRPRRRGGRSHHRLSQELAGSADRSRPRWLRSALASDKRPAHERQGPHPTATRRPAPGRRGSPAAGPVKVQHETSAGAIVTGSSKTLRALAEKDRRVRLLPDTNLIRIYDHVVNIEAADPLEGVATRARVPRDLAPGWHHHLVQLDGPPTPAWTAAIEALGVDVVEPVSGYALFVEGEPAAMAAVGELDFVAWAGPFQPAWRVNPSLAGRRGSVAVRVGVSPPADLDDVRRAVEAAGGEVLRADGLEPGRARPARAARYATILARLDAAVARNDIARLPSVRFVEYTEPSSPMTSGPRRSSRSPPPAPGRRPSRSPATARASRRRGSTGRG